VSDLTETQLRSLRIFANANRPLTPGDFAGEFFESGHPGWQRSGKCGPKGSTKGQGLVLWSGGWLGKLRKAGLIRHSDGWNGHTLTAEGKTALAEANRE